MGTPIQTMKFYNEKGVRLFCKREDLLPFSLGGNKVRIGQQYFSDMKAKNKDCMIVYGNSRSNLCRVLANMCRMENIPCYMICSSNENEHATDTNNSKLMRWLDAEIIPCSTDNIAQTVDDLIHRLEGKGLHPYYIFGDKYGRGNEGTAVQAYVDGYYEISEWEKSNNIKFSHIFFASGSGTTQSGLVSGKILNGGDETIVGISISSRERKRALEVIETGIESYFFKNNYSLPEWYKEEIHLEMDYRAGGYGLFNSEICDVVKQQFCQNGIPLDLTYTGKAFWGMLQYIEKNHLENCDILFVHTGGTPLFYDGLPGGNV